MRVVWVQLVGVWSGKEKKTDDERRESQNMECKLRQGHYLSCTRFELKFECLDERWKVSDEKRYKRDIRQDESETG